MKIRYYIKSFNDKDEIQNFTRGGYLYIEHFKVNGIDNNLLNKDKVDCLYDFEIKKTSKASRLFKKSKITHEIIVFKENNSTYNLFLKPNILQRVKLTLNNKEKYNNLKTKLFKLLNLIIAGIIGAFINQQFQNNKELKNAPNIPEIKQSIKKDILLELKDSYLISKDTLTIDKTEIRKNIKN